MDGRISTVSGIVAASMMRTATMACRTSCAAGGRTSPSTRRRRRLRRMNAVRVTVPAVEKYAARVGGSTSSTGGSPQRFASGFPFLRKSQPRQQASGIKRTKQRSSNMPTLAASAEANASVAPFQRGKDGPIISLRMPMGRSMRRRTGMQRRRMGAAQPPPCPKSCRRRTTAGMASGGMST